MAKSVSLDEKPSFSNSIGNKETFTKHVNALLIFSVINMFIYDIIPTFSGPTLFLWSIPQAEKISYI